MELSDQWRATWCIGSIFSAPELVTGPSAETLGPLLFDCVGDPFLLFSAGYKPNFLGQTSLIPNDEVDHFQCQNREFFVPYDVLHQCVAEDMHKKLIVSLDSNLVLGNRLQVLKCRGGTVQIFFPVGTNMNRIGSICFDKEMEPWNLCKQPFHNNRTNVLDRQLITVTSSIHHPIMQLAVVGRGSFLFDDSTEGFLLARTAYAVHWFRAESREGSHTLKHIAFANFKRSVSHACWNPHLLEESAVILENGELRLFDISCCAESSDPPLELKGKSLPLELTNVRDSHNSFIKEREARKRFWQGLSEHDVQTRQESKESWWHCEYGWHPRIILVAGWNEVQLVDFRMKKRKPSDYATLMAKANSPELSSYCSCTPRRDRIVAFARADYDMFKFAIATQQHILLFDSRQPLTPILQWEHGLKESPGYLQMVRLSELRPSVGNKYKWASDSGHAILAASFRSGCMRVFCYGPRPSSGPNVCSNRVRKSPILSNKDVPELLYSWELPSKLFTVNAICSKINASDLKIQGDLPSTDFLCPKFDKSCLDAWPASILGFCIVSDHQSCKPLSGGLEESEGNILSGFRLLQLTGTGELFSQQYQASRRLIWKKSVRSKICSGFEIPYDGNMDFQKKAECIYRWFPHFMSYLTNDSALELVSSLASGLKLRKQNGRHSLKSGCVLLRELIHRWEASIADHFGSLPPLKDVLHQATIPCSIYEISCKRLWMSLPLEVLELAFAAHSEILSLGRRRPPEFLQISPRDCLRMPLSGLTKLPKENKPRSSKQNDCQLLFGPMLSLRLLLDVEQRMEMISGWTGMSLMSGQAKIKDQCQCISDELKNLKRADLTSQISGSRIVSLEDDQDVWPSQHDLEEDNYLLLHEPSAKPFEEEHHIFKSCGFRNASEDIGRKQLHDSSVHDKFIGTSCFNFPSENDGRVFVMSELHHDISPFNWSFALSESDLNVEEVESLRNFKQKYHKWQKGFRLYQNYLGTNVYRSF